MLITDIKWDVDSEDTLYNLPTEIVVNLPELDANNVTDKEELLDIVSDWLTEKYGYCHDGFAATLTKKEEEKFL